MANDDAPTTISSVTKRPISRKHRILSQRQTTGKFFVEDLHTSTMSSIGNHSPPRLPSLLSKSTVFPSTPETMHFRRHRSPQKDSLNASSSSKIERQSTTIFSQTRLPTLHSTTNDTDQKRRAEFQRRQIYALNHLMRELEQEQFRQFCKLNEVGTENTEEIMPNTEEIVLNNEEPIKPPEE